MEKMLVLSFLGGQDGPKMSNFKSSCYCNFMEKIRKVPFVDFWNPTPPTPYFIGYSTQKNEVSH